MNALHTLVAPMLGIAVRQAYEAHKGRFTPEEWADRKAAFWEGTGRAVRWALLGGFIARRARIRQSPQASASVEILQPQWPAIAARKPEAPLIEAQPIRADQ